MGVVFLVSKVFCYINIPQFFLFEGHVGYSYISVTTSIVTMNFLMYVFSLYMKILTYIHFPYSKI